MPKIMKLVTGLCFFAAVLSAVLFGCLGLDIFLTLAITFGTVGYHLGIRLIVGLIYNKTMNNRADYTKKRYRLHKWESKLYDVLKVKRWKDKLPTYAPELFSNKVHTWDEIAQAMCQSELVHETNVVLSFVPLIASIWFDSFLVFLLTSLGGAIFDLLFVIIQRYNRPRIVKIALKKK